MRSKMFLFYVSLMLILWRTAMLLPFLRPSLQSQGKYNFSDRPKENILFLERTKNHTYVASTEFLKENNTTAPIIAVLLLSCNRVSVVKCIKQLIEYRKSKERFPIVVSQDCSHRATTQVINTFLGEITYIQPPDQNNISVPLKEIKLKGYYRIARHYKWALSQVFDSFKYKTVIVLEDDLIISPDFFEYFLGTYPILENDPTLWCVSAWNDNGKFGLVDDTRPELLYRTDFFPGLGWMLRRSLWKELSVKWPLSYWDDWMREPSQRRNRSCIRPEISRTKVFGKGGVSQGLFYDSHLKHIKLNDKVVLFSHINLTYLLKDNYDSFYISKAYNSPIVSYKAVLQGCGQPSVRIIYKTTKEFRRIANKFGLMEDHKSGIARTAYEGIVTFFFRGTRVFLTPLEKQ